MKKQVFLLSCIFIWSISHAQKITAVADSQQIMIGSPFILNVYSEFVKGQQPQAITLDSLEHFEILNTAPSEIIQNGNTSVLHQSFRLTSWDSGAWVIPALGSGKLTTKPVKINVVFNPSPFDQEQPYHDITEIMDSKPEPESKWYWYIAFALIVLALFLLFFPRSKKKKPEEGFVSDMNVYQTTLQRLDQLDGKTGTDPVLFYTELIDVFRNYLLKRKNIISFSKTTDDLAGQLRTNRLSAEEFNSLVQTLRLSDFVKFARFQPGTSETEQAVKTIKESVIILEHEKDVV